MQNKIIILLSLLCIYCLTGCTTVVSTRGKALWVTNKVLTIGYRFEHGNAAGDDRKLTSFLHIGVPLWFDASGQMQSCLSFSPLLMASEKLYGLQFAPIAGTEQGKGVQCALIGGANSFDGLSLSPISLVYKGNCIQVGLLSTGGIGKGMGGTFGQISVVNLTGGRCPCFQLGLFNGGDMHFLNNKRNNFFQVGLWNSSRVFVFDEYQYKEIGDERKNGGDCIRLLSTKTQCGLVNVTDDYHTSDSIVTGNQLGIVNLGYRLTRNRHNFQCGLINYTDSDNANLIQVGLVNIKNHRLMLFFNR
ncbi:MAG: hypothetical protein IKZ46_14045 [Victivallales bacterium]|nr:hypothetical protein [Victivallales bacterium]